MIPKSLGDNKESAKLTGLGAFIHQPDSKEGDLLATVVYPKMPIVSDAFRLVYPDVDVCDLSSLAVGDGVVVLHFGGNKELCDESGRSSQM